MKHLRVSNFLGAIGVSIELGQHTLIVGPNGSGKSSIQNAIRYALCGDGVRVQLKKDAKLLISDGAKSATIEIDGSQTHITPAKVMYGGDPIAPVPAWLLNMHSFGDATADERSAMLNELSGAMSIEGVVDAAKEAGLNISKVEQVAPLVMASLKDAEDEADKRASGARREWKGITGEVWGSDKGLVWQPVVDPEAKAKMTALDSKIEHADSSLLAILSDINDEERHVLPLRAACEGLDDREADYKKCNELMAERQAVVDGYDKVLVEKNPFEELCSSLRVVAAAMKDGETFCPCCNKQVVVLPADTGPVGIVPFDTAKAAVDANADAIADYDSAYSALSEAINESGRAFQRLSKIREAKAKLDEVTKDRNPDFDITKAKETAESLRNLKNELFSRKQELMKACGVAEQAEELTARAATAHKEISEWLDIAEFFSASGAASALLQDVHKNFTASLRRYAAATGWPCVDVGPDMAITVGGRELRFLSESERWRADAMLAAALVNLSNLDIPVLLDRIDVLDLEGRGQLIGWVEQSEGQWLLFGTLKSRPELQNFSSFWIENGICG